MKLTLGNLGFVPLFSDLILQVFLILLALLFALLLQPLLVLPMLGVHLLVHLKLGYIHALLDLSLVLSMMDLFHQICLQLFIRMTLNDISLQMIFQMSLLVLDLLSCDVYLSQIIFLKFSLSGDSN